MREAGNPAQRPRTLAGLGEAIRACRRCPIGFLDNTAVMGDPHPLADGGELWVTAHPSYLLRLKDEARAEQERLFQADLAAVAERLAELEP